MQRKQYLPALGLVCLVAISAALRLPGLYTSPYWAGDEGYNLNIAQNLVQGRLQMYALSYAFVQHPPLFFLILGAAIKLLGANILTLRLVTAVCGIITTGFVYAIGRQTNGERGGFLAGLLFAVWPLATLSNRWGDTYNLLMLIGAATLWAGLQGIEARRRETQGCIGARGWLLIAAFLAGLGPVSDVEGLYLVAWIVLVALYTDRRLSTLIPVVALAILPGLVFLGWILAVSPDVYMFDLTHNVDRVNKGAAQIITWFLNYQAYLLVDYWLALGLLGLFMLRRGRGAVLGLAVLMLLVILQVRSPNPYFRTAVPTLPVVALGLGMLLDRALAFLLDWLNTLWRGSAFARLPALAGLRPLWTTVPLVIFIGGPLLIATGTSIIGASGEYQTRIDNVLVTQPGNAEKVAAFLNTTAAPDDVVLLSPHYSWLVNRKSAEILQSVVSQGTSAGFYPSGIPANRWVYDPYYRGGQVRYIVVDDFWRTWVDELSKASPGKLPEAAQLADVESTWTPVFQAGEYTVYRRP